MLLYQGSEFVRGNKFKDSKGNILTFEKNTKGGKLFSTKDGNRLALTENQVSKLKLTDEKTRKVLSLKNKSLKEASDTKWKIEIIVNGELTYYNRLVDRDIQEILSVANSINPSIEYESEKLNETYGDYKVGSEVYWVSAGNEISSTGEIVEISNGKMTIKWEDGDTNTYDMSDSNIVSAYLYDDSVNE